VFNDYLIYCGKGGLSRCRRKRPQEEVIPPSLCVIYCANVAKRLVKNCFRVFFTSTIFPVDDRSEALTKSCTAAINLFRYLMRVNYLGSIRCDQDRVSITSQSTKKYAIYPKIYHNYFDAVDV
jgi:hypothetical protein